MFKRFTLLLLLTSSSMLVGGRSLYAQTTAIKSLYRTFNDTYETKADSMTNAFIESFMIKSKGIFNDTYNHYAFNAYWTQAHAIDVIIYAYQRHKLINAQLASKYLSYIKLWYKNKANNYSGAPASSSSSPNTSSDYKMFENPYTDDMCWITLTLLHIGEATGTSTYSIVARQVFDNYIIKRAKEDEATGGLWLPWNTDAGSGPNACTQSPATLIAAKLYQKYGTAKYLDYAKKLYAYTSKKIVFSDGRVEDPPLTYTQGTFAEACRILYHVSDESTAVKNKYKTLAFTYNNYAFTSGRCTNGNNILRDEGHNGDQSIFKAVLIPYAVNYVLDEEMPTNNRTSLCRLILKNTKTMWDNLNLSRYPIVFCSWDWTKSYTGADSDASMGAACCGASLMENSARLCRVITDRYELGALYAECSSYNFEDGQYGETEMAAFNTAMAKAQEILDNPGAYTISDYLKAKNKLSETYQAVLATKVEDFAIIDNTVLNITEEKTYPHITYTRTYDGKWESLYVPFAMKYEDWAEEYDVADIYDFHHYDTNNDGITDEIDMVVKVLKDGNISPNTPYLIRAKSPGEKTLTLPDATVVPAIEHGSDYYFNGIFYTFFGYYNMLTIAQTYTLQDGELVYSEEETALSPQRWCLSFSSNDLKVTASTPARIRILTTEDYASGCISPATSLERNESIFDLSGRHLVNRKLPKGIYIVNGKKVLF